MEKQAAPDPQIATATHEKLAEVTGMYFL